MNLLKEYQEFVEKTKLGHAQDITYCALGVAGEAGEVVEKVKKHLRGDGHFDDPNNLRALLLECGDNLWYIVALAGNLGFTLTDIIQFNMEKLARRHAEGTVKGSGDNR